MNQSSLYSYPSSQSSSAAHHYDLNGLPRQMGASQQQPQQQYFNTQPTYYQPQANHYLTSLTPPPGASHASASAGSQGSLQASTASPDLPLYSTAHQLYAGSAANSSTTTPVATTPNPNSTPSNLHHPLQQTQTHPHYMSTYHYGQYLQQGVGQQPMSLLSHHHGQPPQLQPPAPQATQQYHQVAPTVTDPTGQIAPPGAKPKVTTTLWEDEGTLCFQVEARGICVARREDNDMINGTKLLNVAGMTRGRRDGILKGEKNRHVVKAGAMHLKGVWIPYDRALDFANREKIIDLLYPLFVTDIKNVLYHPSNYHRPTTTQMLGGSATSTAPNAAVAAVAATAAAAASKRDDKKADKEEDHSASHSVSHSATPSAQPHSQAHLQDDRYVSQQAHAQQHAQAHPQSQQPQQQYYYPQDYYSAVPQQQQQQQRAGTPPAASRYGASSGFMLPQISSNGYYMHNNTLPPPNGAASNAANSAAAHSNADAASATLPPPQTSSNGTATTSTPSEYASAPSAATNTGTGTPLTDSLPHTPNSTSNQEDSTGKIGLAIMNDSQSRPSTTSPRMYQSTAATEKEPQTGDTRRSEGGDEPPHKRAKSVKVDE
ncbi:hypothetical protein TRVA0_007S04104 [Trichomonascus vanleenenianus]|uniref:KilA-N domain-containing protein n=1 Tax=Trichomonascus vanleenenianus TaxID=2268995 RepID=UPI003ECACBF6